MKKLFGVQVLYRKVMFFSTIVLTAYTLNEVYSYFVNSPFKMAMENLFYIVICNFGLIFCAIYLNYKKYAINDEELIVQRLWRQDKRYKLSKLHKIKVISGFSPYVKVYFKGKMVPVTCLVEKQDKFIEILQARSKNSGSSGLIIDSGLW